MGTAATYKPGKPPDGWQEWMGVCIIKDRKVWLNVFFVGYSPADAITHNGETYAPSKWVLPRITDPMLRECAKVVDGGTGVIMSQLRWRA